MAFVFLREIIKGTTGPDAAALKGQERAYKPVHAHVNSAAQGSRPTAAKCHTNSKDLDMLF